jgi:hypothetical protein
MKKILLIVVMFLGFGISAQAQTANDPAYVAAKDEIKRYSTYFELSNEKIDELMPLLVKKYNTILNTDADQVTKNEMCNRFATLSLEILGESVATKVEGNKELYNELFGITY